MKLRSPMPDLDGATIWLNGKVSRNDLVGEKPTIIHFWSVSCHLCKESMPDVNTFLDKYKDRMNYITIHMPRFNDDRDIKKIQKVAEQFKIKQPIYVDNDLVLTDTFENEYVPAYYLFDKSGVLRHFQAGGKSMKMLEMRLNRVLDEMNKEK